MRNLHKIVNLEGDLGHAANDSKRKWFSTSNSQLHNTASNLQLHNTFLLTTTYGKLRILTSILRAPKV